MSIPPITPYPMPTAAAMPAARVDWQPHPDRAVLLIHDMQQYFLDFFDAQAAPIPALIANILLLRNACDAAGIPVIYTAQPAEQTLPQRGLLQDWWGPGITARPERAAVVEPLMPRSADIVLTKWRYSAFVSSDLLQRMRAQQRDQLIVCGVYAHIGCMVTSADAFMNDVQVFLVGDAVADFSAQDHAMALSYVAQRCGVVTGTDAVVQALPTAMSTDTQAGVPESMGALCRQLAGILELPVSELPPDCRPFEVGLDSIRFMTLIERWTRDGARIDFVELAALPSVAEWWSLLDARRTS